MATMKPRGQGPRKPTTAKPNAKHSKPGKNYKYRPEGAAATPSSLYAKPEELAELVELTIERLTDDGRGLAFDHGKTIFVEGALDGEVVSASVTKRTSKFNEARVKEISHASPERITAPCPVFTRCGGCSVQHMLPEKQLAFKQNAVLSQLSRWASARPKTLLPALSGNEYGYRQRVRLSVDYSKIGEVSLGFRESTSHRLVNIVECKVLEPKLQPLIAPLREWLAILKPKVIGHIELIHTEDTIGIVVRHTRKVATTERVQLTALIPDAQIWFQSEKDASLENSLGELVDPRIHYHLALSQPLSLSFHPQDFVQSNASINQKMVAQALDLLDPQPDEHIVDLFCGVGNFSLAIAQKAKYVTGVEGIEAMVARAQNNAQQNALDNVTFITKDLSAEDISGYSMINNKRFDKPLSIDGLVLDPPRSGAKAICQNILKLSPKRIVYVSCDSSTFARDAKILIENGYDCAQLGLMDMFPQTAHIELMALFTRTKSKPAKSRAKRKTTFSLKLR